MVHTGNPLDLFQSSPSEVSSLLLKASGPPDPSSVAVYRQDKQFLEPQLGVQFNCVASNNALLREDYAFRLTV